MLIPKVVSNCLILLLCTTFAACSPLQSEKFSLFQRLEILEEDLEDFVHYQPQQTHLAANEDGSSIVVTWTSWNDTDSLVEYGTNPLKLRMVARGSSTKFVDGGDEKRVQYVHRVTLPKLAANTTYFYHCGSDLGWSDLFWFQTYETFGPEWSPSFAIYGDMGNANAQSLPRLQKETQAGMYDMVIHVGDFAYDMDTENGRVGDEFMRQIEALAAYLPYMTVVGNHEQAYNFSNYKNRFSMPLQEISENMFFSFDIGPVHFISISTEFYYYTNYGIKMVANQYKWLVEDLKKATSPPARSRRPWIVLMGHRPMYCSTNDNDDCTKVGCYTRVGMPVTGLYGMEELLYEYSVDLAVWAHEHNYERHFPLYNYTMMKGSEEEPYTNPRATVHLTTGSAGCQERHDPWVEQPPITAFRSNDYGYTRMKAHNATHLEIQQVSDDKDGEVIDYVWLISEHHDFHH